MTEIDGPVIASVPCPINEPSRSEPRSGWDRGEAKIKAEFLIKDYVRELDTRFLSVADQEKLKPASGIETSETPADEAAAKKGPKLKGRNKNRNKQNYRDPVKVCSYITRDVPCPYGEKCRYSHDTKVYLSTKLPDIADKCPVFERTGYCPYGLTCRFGASHLNMDGSNVVPEGVDPSVRQHSGVVNGMSKSLQQALRKRKFDFSDGQRGIGKPARKKEENGAVMEELADVLVPENGVHDERNPVGAVTDEDQIPLRPSEKKIIDFAGKLYLSPLTTVGNLPYRRICKRLGADITCGEMALAPNLLSGQQSEWALMVRHSSEDIFGVQVCGAKPDMMQKLAYLLKSQVTVDFVDINCGCPIDMVCNSGSGCALMGRTAKLEGVMKNMVNVLDVPLTVKIRMGIHDGKNIAHDIIPLLRDWGVSQVSLHGRTRDQRYTKLADWNYIAECAEVAAPMPLFGNGDVMNFVDYYDHLENTKVAGMLIARGALIKPWIFTEIKERRHWDISAQERFDIFKEFTHFGLEQWGSDTRGVETTRRFLLEWMSFTCRYIPVGLLECPPQRINERPPHYVGRSDLETLLSSGHCNDWIKLSEMLLGPVVEGFKFLPKHKANAWK